MESRTIARRNTTRCGNYRTSGPNGDDREGGIVPLCWLSLLRASAGLILGLLNYFG